MTISPSYFRISSFKSFQIYIYSTLLYPTSQLHFAVSTYLFFSYLFSCYRRRLNLSWYYCLSILGSDRFWWYNGFPLYSLLKLLHIFLQTNFIYIYQLPNYRKFKSWFNTLFCLSWITVELHKIWLEFAEYVSSNPNIQNIQNIRFSFISNFRWFFLYKIFENPRYLVLFVILNLQKKLHPVQFPLQYRILLISIRSICLSHPSANWTIIKYIHYFDFRDFPIPFDNSYHPCQHDSWAFLFNWCRLEF